jgi:Arc/MetJ family transcription regulator
VTRANKDIDDKLAAEAMRRSQLSTRKDAGHLALSRLVGQPLDVRLLESVTGIGWDGDLDEMRSARDVDAS